MSHHENIKDQGCLNLKNHRISAKNSWFDGDVPLKVSNMHKIQIEIGQKLNIKPIDGPLSTFDDKMH